MIRTYIPAIVMVPHLHSRTGTAAARNDLLEPFVISGLYGSGTWAAWILAMAASLCTLRRPPDTYATLAMLPPVLYINWAAVDLLKELHSQHPSYEFVASTTGIVILGVWYLSWVQHCLDVRSYSATEEEISRMRILTLVGFMMPAVALAASMISLDVEASLREVKPLEPPDNYVIVGDSSYIRMIDGAAHLTFAMGMVWMCLLHVIVALTVACPSQTHATDYVRALVFSRYKLWHVLFGGGGMFVPSALGRSMSLLEDIAAWEEQDTLWYSCVMKPCAPQSITDSDQGFSLCCGLLLLAYEAGPDAVAFVTRRVKLIIEKLGRPERRTEAWPGERPG
jgi:hypothetical protein